MFLRLYCVTWVLSVLAGVVTYRAFASRITCAWNVGGSVLVFASCWTSTVWALQHAASWLGVPFEPADGPGADAVPMSFAPAVEYVVLAAAWYGTCLAIRRFYLRERAKGRFCWFDKVIVSRWWR